MKLAGANGHPRERKVSPVGLDTISLATAVLRRAMDVPDHACVVSASSRDAAVDTLRQSLQDRRTQLATRRRAHAGIEPTPQAKR